MRLGEKLQKLRKQRGLSQEALAEKVTVTRQTISKWETGQSLPDLDFIAQLSDIFNVTSDYLIRDEMTEPDQLPDRKKTYHFSEKLRRIILALVSASALAAAWVCLVCDYFIGGKKLSWSLIAIVSIAAAWLIILPGLISKTKIIWRTLLTVSVIPIPLLAVLALLLKQPVIFVLGSWISLIVIIALWVIYGIFYKCHRQHVWRGCGFALLVIMPAAIAITRISVYFIPQDQYDHTSEIFNSGIMFILSLICFGYDYLSCQRRKEILKK